MSDIRLIEAELNFEFDLVSVNEKGFNDEYRKLGESEDPISQWYRAMKSKGEGIDADPMVVNLLLELHRKIDRLESMLGGIPIEREILNQKIPIAKIGFDHFELSDPVLQNGEHYYGRISLPTYTKHEIPIFFEASSNKIGHIIRIHSRDENEWNGYNMTKERAMIRYMKGLE